MYPVKHMIHVDWRLALAREIAERLRAFTGIQAIVAGGSVARGYADEYSDLELPLFWDTLPGDDVRHAVIDRIGAQFLRPYNGPECEDNLLIHGFQVDLWHCTVSGEDAVIDNVLLRNSTDFGESNFMDTVRACIPLHGEEIIRRWKARAQAYPDPLAARNIADAIAHFDAGHLDLHAHRDNPTLVYEGVAGLQKRMFLVLLALNRAYFPTFKWMYRVLEAMRLKPANVGARCRQAFQSPPAEAVRDTLGLLGETLDLIDRHAPQVDTAEARQRLRPARRSHVAPVRL